MWSVFKGNYIAIEHQTEAHGYFKGGFQRSYLERYSHTTRETQTMTLWDGHSTQGGKWKFNETETEKWNTPNTTQENQEKGHLKKDLTLCIAIPAF